MLRPAGEHGMGQEEDDWLEAVSASDIRLCFHRPRSFLSFVALCPPRPSGRGYLSVISILTQHYTGHNHLPTVIVVNIRNTGQNLNILLHRKHNAKQADNDGHN